MNKGQLTKRLLDEVLFEVMPELENQIVEDILKDIDEDENIVFSDYHKKQMKKLFRRERYKLYFKNFAKYSKRIAIFLLLAVIIFTFSIFSVEAWRLKFVNFIVDVQRTYSEYDFKQNIETSINRFENEDVCFEYIPNGYEFFEEISNNIETSYRFVSEKSYFRLSLTHSLSKFQIDSENLDAYDDDVMINNSEATYYMRENISYIVWNDGDYLYRLSGENIPKNELLIIAKNFVNKK